MKAALLHACTLLLCLPVAAIEKEVPPKIREGSTTQKPSTEPPRSTESPKPAMKDGERESGKPSAEREGGSKPNAERDGEKKPGIRDGEKPRTGPRDGEGMKKPGAERDAGTPARKSDGEGRKPSAESGQNPRKGSEGSAAERSETDRQRRPEGQGGDAESNTPVRSSDELITLKVIDGGETVLIGDEKVPMNRLRGFLSTFLPEHPGARVVVQAEANTEYKILIGVLDAVRDNGNKNASIKAE